MAVEVLKGENATTKSDIWSLGCIYYELLHGNCLIDESNEYKIIKAIESKKFKPFKPGISPESTDFLMKCLKPVEKERANWDELFCHKLFDNFFIHE